MKSKDRNQKKEKETMIFKWHVIVFFIGMALLWGIWYYELEAGDLISDKKKFPWPVWPMLIWLMALRIHYVAVFKERKNLLHNLKQKK